MMRLIDADALKNSVLKWLPPDPCGQEEKEYPFETDICVSMMQEIEDAPTIESEQKKGKWIDGHRMKFDGTFYWFRQCDQCGYERNDCDTEKDTNFCPNCGADMRGDKDETD